MLRVPSFALCLAAILIAAAGPAFSVDGLRGHSIRLSYFEVQKEIAPRQGTHRSPRFYYIYVSEQGRLFVRFQANPDSKVGSVSREDMVELGQTVQGVTWDFHDGRLVGTTKAAGFTRKLSISPAKASCVAAVVFEKIPGNEHFEMIRISNGDKVTLADVHADNIQCTLAKGNIFR